MNTKKALEILKDHQKWRRGEWEYSEVGVAPEYDSIDLWLAIDYIIKKLEWKTNTD